MEGIQIHRTSEYESTLRGLLDSENVISSQTRQDLHAIQTLANEQWRETRPLPVGEYTSDLPKTLSSIVSEYALSTYPLYISTQLPLHTLGKSKVQEYTTTLSHTALSLLLGASQEYSDHAQDPDSDPSSIDSYATSVATATLAHLAQHTNSIPHSFILSILLHLTADLLHTPFATIARYTHIPAYLIDLTLPLGLRRDSTPPDLRRTTATHSVLPSPTLALSLLTTMAQSLYTVAFSAMADLASSQTSAPLYAVMFSKGELENYHAQQLEKHAAIQNASNQPQTALQALIDDLHSDPPSFLKLRKATAVTSGHIPNSQRSQRKRNDHKNLRFPISSLAELDSAVGELTTRACQQRSRDVNGEEKLIYNSAHHRIVLKYSSADAHSVSQCTAPHHPQNNDSISQTTTSASTSASWHRYGTHAVPAAQLSAHMRRVEYLYQLYRGRVREEEIGLAVARAKAKAKVEAEAKVKAEAKAKATKMLVGEGKGVGKGVGKASQGQARDREKEKNPDIRSRKGAGAKRTRRVAPQPEFQVWSCKGDSFSGMASNHTQM